MTNKHFPAQQFFCLSALLLALFSAPKSAPAQPSAMQERPLPDSADVRKKLSAWFTSPLSEVRVMRNEVHTSERGQVFQVRMEEKTDSFNIIVSPREEMIVDVYSDEGIYSELTYAYVSTSPGSWVLTRDSLTGKPLSIVFYFMADANVYVKITPGDNKCFADLVIFDSFAVRGVEIGVPFERLYGASFSELRKWTPSIPWFYTARPNSLYEGVQHMINVIRNNQNRFVFVPNVAYNESGESVDILTGKKREENPSGNKLEFSDAGFVKWIIDGLVKPFAENYTPVSSLVTQTVSYKTGGFQGVLATQYNLSFALDWTRNLAAAMISAKNGKAFSAKDAGVDVTVEPFALSPVTTYTVNSGYPAEGLLSILYVLAVTDPEMFYLAAIRQTDRVSPEVHFFSRCAVIFPYFDDRGRFNVCVFENGAELSLAQFIEKYKKDSIHLTRVESSERFFPQ